MINENTGETGGIYFSPGFDILIISSAIIIAYFIKETNTIFSVENTVVIFLGVDIASYVISFFGVFIVGYLRSKNFN
ncbi:MAG: hypothetical protein P8X89_24435 [Reinekea sp.]